MNPEETMPCAVCDKPLESVGEDWKHFQPFGGCELQIIGSFGSRKFDHDLHATVYRGLICDECAEKLVGKMVGPNARSAQ